MASELSNISAVIDSFKNDLQDCTTKFETINDSFIKCKCDHQRRKCEMTNILSDLHNDLLLNLNGIDAKCLPSDSEIYPVENFNGVLESYKQKFIETTEEAESLKNNFFDLYSEFQSVKELSDPECSIPRIPDKTNYLQCRQTSEPFIVIVMRKGKKYTCRGCREIIPIQSLYLSHKEEYPAGSKIYTPHNYHINRNCLLHRGFEESYLKRTEVSSKKRISKDILDILREIGFIIKNFQPEIPNFSDKDSSESDDSDFQDDRSDCSNVPSIDLGHTPAVTFVYHRKPPAQKRKIICKGCQSTIETEAYISHENNKIQSMFHIRKSCLQSARMIPEDRNRIKIMTYRLLRTHDELKELIYCGFYYSRIIGFRPQNPNAKKPQNNAPIHQTRPMDRPRQNTDFLANEEPFVCQRLPHGEKCKGCQNGIRRDDMSLRHKERVPRDKLDSCPLISQYYHPNKECLLSRGFPERYLSFIKCNAILSGEDNLSRMTDILINCGFSNENIVYSPKDTQEVKGFEVSPISISPNTTKPKKDDKEYKLFVDNCANSSIHCEGCGFILTPAKPCFVYALSVVQDSNAKMFHIRNSCLKNYFTKEQIMAMICVLSNEVDVSPREIISCGIVKIVPDNKYASPPKKRPMNVNRPRPRSNNQNNSNHPRQRLTFIVDIVVDDRHVCCTCKQDLVIDKYILVIKNRDPDKSQLHLDPLCVEKLGISRDELAKCLLSFSVYVSADGEKKIQECGFRNIRRLDSCDV